LKFRLFEKKTEQKKEREIPPLIVGLYIRTNILTDKYDRYEKALLFYCKKQGWSEVRYYRDKVGGRFEQSSFDKLEAEIKSAKRDANVIDDLVHNLFQQQSDDDSHNRDAFGQMITDAANGKISVVLVYDVGQLGRNRQEVFQLIRAIDRTGAKLHITQVGEVHNDTIVFDSSSIIDSPDSFKL
jgi:DNA invertase Pin-like site-specific DNA recombinase